MKDISFSVSSKIAHNIFKWQDLQIYLFSFHRRWLRNHAYNAKFTRFYMAQIYKKNIFCYFAQPYKVVSAFQLRSLSEWTWQEWESDSTNIYNPGLPVRKHEWAWKLSICTHKKTKTYGLKINCQGLNSDNHLIHDWS